MRALLLFDLIHISINVVLLYFYSLPDWANEVLKTRIDVLEYFAAIYFGGATQSIAMKKAKAGYLLKEIFDRFRNKTKSLLRPDRKLWIYSAHDNTIVNTLSALNVYDVICFEVKYCTEIIALILCFCRCAFHPLLHQFISK